MKIDQQKVSVLKKRTLIELNRSILVQCHLKVGSKSIIRQSIEHPGCVVIIPQLGRDQFLLVKQYRYATRGWIWEFPAGGIEPKESILRAANRELMEEVGYSSKKFKKLVSFYPTPGISEEKMHLFLARDLMVAYAEKDADEEFEIKAFKLKQIEKMIRSEEIQDGKTIIGFAFLKGLLGRIK